ncbi:MAG: hypothetical protein ABI780_11565 [Ardenticatenales bacterium]
MTHRPQFGRFGRFGIVALAAAASAAAALAPRSVARADTHALHRIYLPFAVGPGCRAEAAPDGPTPGPLPTLAARRWQNVRPANDVQTLTFDERTGEVWSAGFDGTARWWRDAKTVTSYTDADGLAWAGTVGVAIGSDGAVWAAGNYGGDGLGAVARLRPDGRWGTIAAPISIGHIAVDRAGGMWVGGENGAARLGSDCGWEYPPRGYPLGAGDRVVDILAARNGDIWIATVTDNVDDGAGHWSGRGGVAVRRADGRWTAYGSADGLRIDDWAILDLAEAPDGHVWALIDGSQYSAADHKDRAVIDRLGDDGHWAPAPLADFELLEPANQPSAVVWDADGQPWFRGDNGIYVPDGAGTGRWRVDYPAPTDVLGTPSLHFMSALAVDASGTAWVGTGDQLYRRLPDGTWRDEWLDGPQYPYAVGTRGDEVWMDLAHRSADGGWQSAAGGFPTGVRTVNDLAITPDGVWYATDAGLVRRAPDGTWTRATDPAALAGRAVAAVVAAADGSAWAVAADAADAGRGASIARHRPDGRWEAHSTATGLPSGTVRGVAVGGVGGVGGVGADDPEGADGAVWVGVEDGATRHVAAFAPDGRWTEIALPPDLRSGGILAMAGDASGALWLFDAGHGLVRRNADGTWDAFADQPALDLHPADPTDKSRTPALAIAPDGAAWIGGRNGEVRVRTASGEWRSLMLLDWSSVRDIAFGPDGRAWMTMVDGGSPRVVEVGP